MANSDNPTTVSAWALGLMRRMNISPTGTKGYATWAVLCVWALKEGGHWKNSAKYNPLNTSQPMPGSSKINSHGVQAYTSWEQGYEATIKTLTNGRYNNMVADLKAGDSAKFVRDLAASPWGTGSIVDPKGNIPSGASKPGAVANTITDIAQDVSDSITGDTTSADYTTAEDSAVGWTRQLTKLLETVNSAEFWKRTGIFAGGVMLILLAVLVMLWSQKSRVIGGVVGDVAGGATKALKDGGK
jgi:hypothetical protein